MRIEQQHCLSLRLVITPTDASKRATRPRSFSALLQQPQHLSARDAQAQLSGAWTAVVGQAPSRETAQLLLAHWALETDGGRAMPGHNFAGIKASPAANGAIFSTIEGHGDTRREVSARFRVYDSPEAGARDYVNLLKTRYPAALEAARLGVTADFAGALSAGGYFTADPAAYAAALRQRRENIERSAFSVTNGSPPPFAASLAEVALGGLLHAFRATSDDA